MPTPALSPVLITGATGLVGQGVLAACLATVDRRRIVALVRRPLSLGDGVETAVLADFMQAGEQPAIFAGLPLCFYCAGAPPVGTPEAQYRKVTVDTTLAVARAWAAANPEGTFFYVSGAFAGTSRPMMALRVKGEVEQALQALPVRTVMLRPGGVYPVPGTGTRHTLLKPLYAIGGPVMRLLVRVLPAVMTSNAAIGRAMIALSRQQAPASVVECAQINQLAEAVR